MTTDLQSIIDQLYPYPSATLADPYTLYAAIREQEAVFWQAAGNSVWHLTRYSDIIVALRDPRFSVFSSLGEALEARENMAPEERERAESFRRDISSFMMLQDPPDHTRLRTLVLKAITPHFGEKLRVRIQDVVDTLLVPHLSKGSMDIIRDLALPLPLAIIIELLGIPVADRKRFQGWSDKLFNTKGTTNMQRVPLAQFEIIHYLRTLVAERRVHPSDDLISDLAMVSHQGGHLQESEVIAQCYGILVEGCESTTALLANGMFALLTHSHIWQELYDHDDLLESAVEELLRYDSPVQFVERTARNNIYLNGQVIRARERIVLWLGAANRDPQRFSDPDDIKLARQDNRHLAFSGGSHYCLGAVLARLEGQIAFRALLHSLSNVKLEANTFVRYPGNPALRTVEALPITFTPIR
jgi:cytochrome P450